MSTNKLNYDKDVMIEPDALDLEWLKQPKLYMKYAELSAEAEREVRRCKDELKLVDASVELDIRENGEGKVTDKRVAAEVEVHEEHIKAVHDLNEALYHAQICQAAVKAMDHKKTALENEVRLWAGSYFSGPKEPRDLKEEMELDMKEMGRERGKDAVRRRARKRLDS